MNFDFNKLRNSIKFSKYQIYTNKKNIVLIAYNKPKTEFRRILIKKDDFQKPN